MSCYSSEQLLLHSLLVSLSLLSLFAVCCFGHAEVECHPDHRSSLLTLKDGFSFKYTDDKLPSWTPGSNCCDWDGVSCDPSSGHVDGLDLSNRGIYGNISSSLFNLKSMQTLNLAYNLFDGPLPQSGFEKLTKLIHLNLSGCDLSGQIPIGISRLTRLISLDLSSNSYGIQLGNPNFQTLVRNLSHLRELHLDRVYISSGIEWSETFSLSLPRLQVLTLADCDVSGILPHNFFLLRNWTTLDLRGNPIVCELLRGFPENSHLEVLRLSLTCINGSLSDSIRNLKYLRELQIAGEGEQFGMIPSSIWNLTRLVRLGLTDFIDTIPTSIGNLTQLQYLHLSNNNLIGTIPTSIGNLTQLKYLDLSYNNLNGPIPDSLFSLPVIQALHLSSNNLNGTIPTSIGNLTQLQYLDLSNNNLNGPFPDSLFSLPVIQKLYLNHNQLQGQIPRSIFKLPSLVILDLRSNNLSGTVELDMFERLKNLTYLDLSNNNMSSGFRV